MKISIWTGAAYEPWNPQSLESGGIGGSETAAIHMARELARRGHEVTMFGEHQDLEGWYGLNFGFLVDVETNGPTDVRYVDYRKAIADPSMLSCDVFISSRDKRVVRLKPEARVKVLWIHDINVGDDWENDVNEFDRLYCLSPWHKSYLEEVYPHLEPGKLEISRNGIDPARFAELDWQAKKPAFVYSSSPDRGLDVLLDVWPQIKEFRPEATLDVYYGFGNWRKLNATNKRGLAVIDYMESRVSSMEDLGVRYHGRVGQSELAEAHKRAMVWAYPTQFVETFCISALEAQAAGAAIVTSKLAGLMSTVGERGILLEGRNKSREYQDAFIDGIKAMMTGIEAVNRLALGEFDMVDPRYHHAAVDARKWALTQTWESLAAEWEADFERLMVDKKKET